MATPKDTRGETRRAPAHVQVRQKILDLIEREALPIGSRIPPEIALAELLGVSRMTANKSIQNLVQEGWLSREQGIGTFVSRLPGSRMLEECILWTGEETDYALSNYYYASLIGAVRTRLVTEGVSVRFGGLERPSRRSSPDALGFLVINPPRDRVPEIAALRTAGHPVAVLGATWNGIRDICIDSDNVLGALMATSHLLGLGHERILMLGAYPQDANTEDRIRGYQLAIKSSLPPPQLAALRIFASDLESGSEDEAELRQTLSGRDRQTAIFAAGPRLAMRVLSLCRELSVDIPDQLSLVGYDDPEFFELSVPPLTTVRQPLAAMADVACSRLLGGTTGSCCLDPELVRRGTTSALPPGGITYEKSVHAY